MPYLRVWACNTPREKYFLRKQYLIKDVGCYRCGNITYLQDKEKFMFTIVISSIYHDKQVFDIRYRQIIILVKNLQSIHSKLLSPSEPGKGVQDSRRGSSVNGNLRTNDANGKRRPSGNGHISRSSSGRNFGFLRYFTSYFLLKCTNKY